MKLLNPNTVIEPLILNWYAWTLLIPPHIHGLYIKNHQLPSMESFVSSPSIHEQAIKSAQFKGGPFLEINPKEISEVEKLINQTKEKTACIISLANDIENFSKILIEENNQQSLERFYPLLPESLKGLCELVYDIQGNVSIRFFEKLIYKKYYNPIFQSFKISLSNTATRPFASSTPKISDETALFLNIPFSHSAIDCLAQARTQPTDEKVLFQNLGLDDKDIKAMQPYLISANEISIKKSNSDIPDDSVLVRYFGHASVLIQTKQINILVDPAIKMNITNENKCFTVWDLPETIDCVLLTHNHQDHIMLETLLQLRHKIKNIVIPASNTGSLLDPSLKLILETIGFTNIIIVEPFDEVNITSGSILSLPFLGEHGDLDIRTKTGFCITVASKRLVFLADSNNLDPTLYDLIHKQIGKIDALYIGMECVGAPFSWVYGSLFSKRIERQIDQSRRLNGSDCSKGLEILRSLKPERVFVYAMGLEEWMNYILAVDYTENSPAIVQSNLFLEQCIKLQIPAKRLFMKDEILL